MPTIVRGVLITCLLYFAATNLLLLGFFFALFLPMPTLVSRIRLGGAWGAAVPLAAGAVMGATAVSPGEFFFFCELLLAGYILGELFERRLSVEKTVMIACGVLLTAGAFFLILVGNMTHNGPVAMVSDYVGENLEMTVALYREIGIPEESLQAFSEALPTLRKILVRIFPALTVSFTLMTTWAIILISRPLLKSRGIGLPAFGDLTLWKPPETLVWAAIGAGFCAILPFEGLKYIGFNVLIVLMAVYFLAGIAIVAFFFDRMGFPRLLRTVLYALVVIHYAINCLVIGLGFFDVWLNLRRIDGPKDED